MIVSVLQPGYLPYVGFFNLMARCDVFVLYDDVQYDKNSWRNRNRILGANGPHWLTVPVASKKLSQLLCDVAIDETRPWRAKHMKSLAQAYARAPHFAEHRPFFEDTYAQEWSSLLELDLHIIDYLAGALGVATRRVRSSALRSGGTKTARLVDICRALDATTYISTNGAKAYLEPELFERAGIALTWQDYSPMPYPQLGDTFVGYLAAVDLLFNCGPEAGAYLHSEDGPNGPDGRERP